MTESSGKEHGFDFGSLYINLCLGGCCFAISNSGCSKEPGAVGSSAKEPSWLRTVPVADQRLGESPHLFSQQTQRAGEIPWTPPRWGCKLTLVGEPVQAADLTGSCGTFAERHLEAQACTYCFSWIFNS